jgi:hypothetical protein
MHHEKSPGDISGAFCFLDFRVLVMPGLVPGIHVFLA